MKKLLGLLLAISLSSVAMAQVVPAVKDAGKTKK